MKDENSKKITFNVPEHPLYEKGKTRLSYSANPTVQEFIDLKLDRDYLTYKWDKSSSIEVRHILKEKAIKCEKEIFKLIASANAEEINNEMRDFNPFDFKAVQNSFLNIDAFILLTYLYL